MIALPRLIRIYAGRNKYLANVAGTPSSSPYLPYATCRKKKYNNKVDKTYSIGPPKT